MKMIIKYLLACVFVASCVNNQNSNTGSTSDSLIVEEDTLNMWHTREVVKNVPTEICEDEYFVMHQPKNRRLVYIPKCSFERLITQTNVFLLDSIQHKTYKYTVFVNDGLYKVFPGRTEDEIYVFSIGGSGRFCNLVRLPLVERYRSGETILETARVVDAKRTNRGFLVSFNIPEYQTEDGESESWEEEYDFDGNIIATYKQKKHHQSNNG